MKPSFIFILMCCILLSATQAIKHRAEVSTSLKGVTVDENFGTKQCYCRLYLDPQYAGENGAVYSDFDNFPILLFGWSARVSSFVLSDGCYITIKDNYGTQKTFYGDVLDLTRYGWNDRATTMEWGTLGKCKLRLYAEKDYKGKSADITESLADTSFAGLGGQVSSFKIWNCEDKQVTACSKAGFTGSCFGWAADKPSLVYNNKIGSIRIS